VLAPLPRLLLLPYLLLAELSWRVQARFEPAYAEVADGVFVGRRPRSPEEVPPAVRRVLDLTNEFGRSRHLRRVAYRTLPTLDGSAPHAGGLLAELERLRGAPGPVFFHCAVGHGRSATAAAVHLVLRGDAEDIAGAEAMMQSRRPSVRLHGAQRVVAERLVRHALGGG
jgi:hypothetical protein